MTNTGNRSRLRSLRTAWPSIVPVAALVVLGLSWGSSVMPPLAGAIAVVLIGAVLSAVYHAEVIAHRFGEPFGTLVLAVAVTVIEVALILTLMGSGSPGSQSLVRDTVFAAFMITVNGIAGLSLLIGAIRHGLAHFNPEGTGAALAVVSTLATLTLVLPAFTFARPGPEYSPLQLGFAAVASLALYAYFVVTQTVHHRDFFLPVPTLGKPQDRGHAPRPGLRATALSFGLLCFALVAVVGLAKTVAPTIAAGVTAAGIPGSFVGAVIALLVLLPEALAATRAAARDRMQTSLNLVYGSAIASIGLTIPAIAVASIWLEGPLTLGLGGTQIVLLILTVVVGALTVAPGRATRLQGCLHLVIFSAFVFLAMFP
ncbi:calcium:proton antiporter [Arthrobacter globiformis]|uniref:calcium:proton antiporter n=1 Tax=Arthrobacter globiformis TaxID=1665 RepID=UPI000B41E18F|nr:ionic transporter y4hA [Arthrobacter globiformis]